MGNGVGRMAPLPLPGSQIISNYLKISQIISMDRIAHWLALAIFDQVGVRKMGAER
jgi:predicted transcriptional regulator of viral defense system